MKSRLFILLVAVLTLPCACLYAKTDVTAEGEPFQSVAASPEDTGFMGSGGPNNAFTVMTDGDVGTKHDTWSGDFNGTNEYDSVGMRFASGISGVAVIEINVGTFGDGGWWNSAQMQPVVQVTTDPAFADYTFAFHTDAGDDNIWMTVPSLSDYPTDVLDNDNSAENNGANGVPSDGSFFTFELDYPETIYGVRIIGNGGGYAGSDPSGFIGTAEIKVYTGSSRARIVSPTYGQIDVPVSTQLQWITAVDPNTAQTNPAVTGHYVYLGTDPDNLVQQGGKIPVGTTHFSPTLAKDTTYFWRIDEELNSGGISNVITGFVSMFDTELSLPVIDAATPSDTLAWPGDDATFTVVATDPLGGQLAYAWFHDPNDSVTGDETQLSDGIDYQGTATDTLTVINVQDEDLGTYYCVVSNTSGPTESVPASLIKKELIAHWPLDSNGDDITGNGLDGTIEGGASFDTGMVGQAMNFDGVDDFVDLPDGFADFSTGLSITLWAKVTDLAPNWARFFDFGNGSNSDNIILAKSGVGATNLTYVIYHGGTGAGDVHAYGAIELDVWKMYTITQDVDGKVVLYVNGETAQTSQYTLPGNIVRINNYIGRSNWDGDGYYKGMMDDVRMYNCALTAVDIARLYNEVTGQSVCAVKPELDFNDNCIVDLGDFALFAEEWMKCNLIPESFCD